MTANNPINTINKVKISNIIEMILHFLCHDSSLCSKILKYSIYRLWEKTHFSRNLSLIKQQMPIPM